VGVGSTEAVALAVTALLALEDGVAGDDVEAVGSVMLLITGVGAVALGVAGAVALGVEGRAGLDEAAGATDALAAAVLIVAAVKLEPKFRASEPQPPITTVPSTVAQRVGDKEFRDSISERVIFFTGSFLDVECCARIGRSCMRATPGRGGSLHAPSGGSGVMPSRN
jgi:hypothetical protein